MKLVAYILLLVCCLTIAVGYFVNGQSVSTLPPFAALPDSPWVLDELKDEVGAEIYASCASCHLADGSGRSDGEVPRVAGQSEKVLLHKLQKLRDGSSYLPVMIPFARALTSEELEQVVRYMASLPSVDTISKPGSKWEIRGSNAAQLKYQRSCSACHGVAGEGNDTLLSPKLCGQHARYLVRRMTEIQQNLRGDADLAMVSIVKTVSQDDQNDIAQWLARVQCSADRLTASNFISAQETVGNPNGS